MGLFDKLKNMNHTNSTPAVKNSVCKTKRIVFEKLPADVLEFRNLPAAALADPFDTAALTVLAFCFYSENKEECFKMLDYLRGPRPLSVMDKQFIADRFRDKDYVPRSYFEGATVANNYLPAEPYTVVVSDNPYSYQNETYATLYVRSGGADSLRSIQLRLAKDGKWYLWEQFILADIRQPECLNPWA